VPIRNGASPVASALSIRTGATPRGPIHPITPLPNQPSEPDISTLLGLGRFYFAATEKCVLDRPDRRRRVSIK